MLKYAPLCFLFGLLTAPVFSAGFASEPILEELGPPNALYAEFRPTEHSGVGTAHWGGANDGPVRLPLKAVRSDVETLTVDLAADRGPAKFRASGFLHGISLYEPPDDLVAPLKPRLFRLSPTAIGLGDLPGVYERVTRMGAKIHVGLSHAHGCSAGGKCPGDDGNWEIWEKALDYILALAKQKRYTALEWDIWNEPNLTEYWSRDHDRYLEMWRRTVLKLRAWDPRAVVVGPSICGYDAAWLQSFLLWTRDKGVLPDVICWHEFGDPRDIPVHAAHMRRFLKENDIKIHRFSLNEIIGGSYLTRPGPTAWYLHSVEESGIESAAHACWEDEKKGVFGCQDGLLDGVLTYDSRQPRSTWWVYRRYADITGRLLRVKPTASAAGIAGRDDLNEEVRVLIGRDAAARESLRLRFVNLHRTSFLKPWGRIRVTVEHIPDSGWKRLIQPTVIMDEVRQADSDELAIAIPTIGPTDACFVRLRRP